MRDGTAENDIMAAIEIKHIANATILCAIILHARVYKNVGLCLMS
jgi:hypothetical protein